MFEWIKEAATRAATEEAYTFVDALFIAAAAGAVGALVAAFWFFCVSARN